MYRDLLEALEDLIREHGLERRRDAIVQAAKPSIEFKLKTWADERWVEGAPTSSRVGGLPALADAAAWPTLPDGRPLSFLAQIDVTELPAIPTRSLLPEAGLLSFFYDCEQQPWGDSVADAVGWRVLYAPDPSSLAITAPPQPTRILTTCQTTFKPAITVPASRSIALDPLELSQDERERYWDFRNDVLSLVDDGALNRILGHPDAIQGCMQRTAQFVTRDLDLPKGVYSWYEHPRAAELIPGAVNWTLLFQFGTNAELLDFTLVDEGCLFFWIHADALAARRFDQTWLFFQSH